MIAPKIALVVSLLSVVACSSPTDRPTDSLSVADAGAVEGSTDREPWRFGNAQDEEAFCRLEAEAMSGRPNGSECTREYMTRSLANCAKSVPCMRELVEPDFLERQRSCLEAQKVACKFPPPECSGSAGLTYPDGAALRLACEAKSRACKKAGVNLDLACSALGAITASFRSQVSACFASSADCKGVHDCALNAGGAACAR